MNVLTARQRERILERLRRGDSLRKIQAETGHRRETIARLGRRAGIIGEPAPFIVSELPLQLLPPSRCEPFRDYIEERVRQCASARTIHRELVAAYGFNGAYNSVKRFVRKLRVPATSPQGCAIASFPKRPRPDRARTSPVPLLRAA